MQGAPLLSRGAKMVRLSLAAASLVRIEQQLTQRDENDNADERPKEYGGERNGCSGNASTDKCAAASRSSLSYDGRASTRFVVQKHSHIHPIARNTLRVSNHREPPAGSTRTIFAAISM